MPEQPVRRRFLRESQPAQIVLCVFLGIAVGAVTLVMHDAVTAAHRYIFALQPGERLSATTAIDKNRMLGIPVLGGLLLGVATLLMNWRRRRDIVDPIEANAVYGGRMSIVDSLRVLLATLISNGAGGSIGMEAAYTQVGASLMSWVGDYLQLRREDMRIFVAAGAAAAIAAAFNAPLAGAFYGFELVLGVYKISALPQVTFAALAGALFLRLFGGGNPIFSLTLQPIHIVAADYPAFLAVGIVAAGVSIATMKLVTVCEHLFKKLIAADWLRPAAGGLALGLLALVYPQVLGSGQGGIGNHLHSDWPMFLLAGLLAAKMLGTAFSLGSGFRGGLFSASLFIGCLLGQISGLIAAHFFAPAADQSGYFMLAGIGSVAAAVIGAPFTMVFLVMETTGDFPATVVVLAGAIVSSTITRLSFGYSFSTWRFHLRGLRISGPHDIGWVNELTMQRIMQPAPRTVDVATPLTELRARFPAGSAQWIFVTDSTGDYHGLIQVADMYGDGAAKAETAADLAKGRDFFLLPTQNIRTALDLFATAKLEDLPVLTSAFAPKVIGGVSEKYLLKIYAQELEAQNAV